MSEAGASLARLAEVVGLLDGGLPSQRGSEQDLETLSQAALRLLLAEPDRDWRPVELCRALEAAGMQDAARPGVHARLLARLRAKNAVVYGIHGRFRARPGLAGSDLSAGAPLLLERPPDRDWDAITEAAVRLLRAEPGRVWRPAELSRAVAETGVEVIQLRGLHFGLLPRLRALGVIQDAAGGFQLSTQGSPQSSPVAARPPIIRRRGETEAGPGEEVGKTAAPEALPESSVAAPEAPAPSFAADGPGPDREEGSA